MNGFPEHLHVAAAVIEDEQGRILIARRPRHAHQGGLWEFPGGKVEPGETVLEALHRELREELGIEVLEARPLIRIPHSYPDRQVLLDVWRVNRFSGVPHGGEGQPVRAVEPMALDSFSFPAANVPIVTAALLPSLYLITPEPGPAASWPVFLGRLETVLGNSDIKLVQFRAKILSESAYSKLALRVCDLCHRYGARLLLNGDPALVSELGADGVHLSSERLRRMSGRPLARNMLVGASCHNGEEIRHAARISADFAVVSPIRETRSHPGVQGMGWDGLRALTEQSPIPVYALGGVGRDDLSQAWVCGAQGVAAISALWGA